MEEKELATYEDASQKEEWIRAMEEEILALVQNQTWELVPRLRDVMPISCEWVSEIKTRLDGTIERYKA